MGNSGNRFEILCGLLLLGAPCIWAFQALGWLQTGLWRPQPIVKWLKLSGLTPPMPSEPFFRLVLDRALDLPVSVLFLVMPCVVWLAADMLAKASKPS
jgi:hypothetical protein